MGSGEWALDDRSVAGAVPRRAAVVKHLRAGRSVCMCDFIAYYSSVNMWMHLITQTLVCAWRCLSWSSVAAWVDKFIETKLCPLLFVVAFRHRAHLVVVRVQVRRGQVEVVCTRAGGCKKQGDEKKRRAKVCHVRWKARTMAEGLCPPLVIDEIQQGWWLMNVGDEAAVLHR